VICAWLALLVLEGEGRRQTPGRMKQSVEGRCAAIRFWLTAGGDRRLLKRESGQCRPPYLEKTCGLRGEVRTNTGFVLPL